MKQPQVKKKVTSVDICVSLKAIKREYSTRIKDTGELSDHRVGDLLVVMVGL